MAGPSKTSYLMRRARRLFVSVTPLVLVLLLSSCVGGESGVDRNSSAGGGNRVYRNRAFGFRFSHPVGFPTRGFRHSYVKVSFEGTVVTNMVARRAFVDANDRDLSKLPARSVVLLIQHMGGGPPPALEMQEEHFPLRVSSFVPLRRMNLPQGASWREHPFSANGWNFLADVYFGPRASQSDRAAIWRIVTSLRFRSLRSGQRTGSGFLVLKKKDSYPVGSIERLSANRFLVRAPHGFYGIGGLADAAPSVFPCPVRLERATSEFVCVNGPRRWNRVGRPLWKGASDRDYLGLLLAVKVGQDGHVLFNSGLVYYGNPSLERKYWGNSVH